MVCRPDHGWSLKENQEPQLIEVNISYLSEYTEYTEYTGTDNLGVRGEFVPNFIGRLF